MSKIVSIISGAAAKASGGDFVQGALSAMVVWLYNEIDVQAELYGIPSSENEKIIRDEKALNVVKNFGRGAASIFKGLYNFGDYLGRLSGLRDWQEGSVVLKDYYKNQAILQTKYTYYIVREIVLNEEVRTIFKNAAIQYINNNKAYVVGRVLSGFGISFLSKVPLVIPAEAGVGDIMHNVQHINEFTKALILGE